MFLFHLIFGVFSVRSQNMRFPNGKRILMVLLLTPVFLTILLVNRIFLLLDFLIAPGFLKTQIDKPIFIVGSPRSGTTFLFHSLAAKTEVFTCFKLWEIVFAPSVLQKRIGLLILKCDRLIGSPVKRSLLYLEKILLGNIKTVHPIGLNLPEEDEALLLWDLNSLYFNFFYPEADFFDELLLFDQKISLKRRTRIMKRYRRYVQRHMHVFNPEGNKQFLSKNPMMMCKLETLQLLFPDAIILNTQRFPGEVIPSTIALNQTLYGLFTSKKCSDAVNERTKEILVAWYQMAHRALLNCNSKLHIDFKKLISRDEKLQQDISKLLNKELGLFLKPIQDGNVSHKSKNRYAPMSADELSEVLKELPFLETFHPNPHS
ncbi:MAG: hypothetical protein RIT43_124 [Bacteroidota bacterium]|jgi:hypothetical protein